jgi:hypothetical protein
MGYLFEWNPRKARSNISKHEVTFPEAATVFSDDFEITIHDPLHSIGEEDRFTTIGRSKLGTLLVVVYCERGHRIRIISARKATRRERIKYEKGL